MRINYLSLLLVSAAMLSLCQGVKAQLVKENETRSSNIVSSATGAQDRSVWVETLIRLSDPVLTNLANGTLKQNMPYESLAGNRQRFSHLEAVGRTVCGIAPWLELGPDHTPEGLLRKHYIELAVKGLTNAVNPKSPDYLIFNEPTQPLVDAAFLAQGLLRAPHQFMGQPLWQNKTRTDCSTEE